MGAAGVAVGGGGVEVACTSREATGGEVDAVVLLVGAAEAVVVVLALPSAASTMGTPECVWAAASRDASNAAGGA